MKEKLKGIGGVFILLVVMGGGIWASTDSASSPGGGGRYGEHEDTVQYEEDMESLAHDHWDEVREYISGSETIEACSDSGCYSLDADISDGTIETVYFPNGGCIYPDAEINDDGTAEGYGSDDRYWEFQVDMDSSLVQDAISGWVSDYQSDRTDYSERDSRF